MSYLDHYMTCDYCRNKYVAGRYEFSTESGKFTSGPNPKPTVRIKGASCYAKGKKLSELSAIIKGVSYPSISIVGDAKAAKLK